MSSFDSKIREFCGLTTNLMALDRKGFEEARQAEQCPLERGESTDLYVHASGLIRGLEYSGKISVPTRVMLKETLEQARKKKNKSSKNLQVTKEQIVLFDKAEKIFEMILKKATFGEDSSQVGEVKGILIRNEKNFLEGFKIAFKEELKRKQLEQEQLMPAGGEKLLQKFIERAYDRYFLLEDNKVESYFDGSSKMDVLARYQELKLMYMDELKNILTSILDEYDEFMSYKPLFYLSLIQPLQIKASVLLEVVQYERLFNIGLFAPYVEKGTDEAIINGKEIYYITEATVYNIEACRRLLRFIQKKKVKYQNELNGISSSYYRTLLKEIPSAIEKKKESVELTGLPFAVAPKQYMEAGIKDKKK